MARKRTRKTEDIFDLAFDETVEEDGFNEVISGTPISTFSFSDETPTSSVSVSNSKDKLIDNRKGKQYANGITPPIDGERFDIIRTYIFRKSTIRKLNELKAIHPDVNAYLSSIIDAAINHYYDYIIKENWSHSSTL